MLHIPKDSEKLRAWAREIVDECMASNQERGMVYGRAHQYYYMGTYDIRAAIYNKVKNFVDRLSGFLMQPTDVRFNLLYDTTEPEDVLLRAQVCSDKLTADYRNTDANVKFAEGVTWSLINGCQIIKHNPDYSNRGFSIIPVHPQNFGVLSETILDIEEQEAVCHISYPTISRLRSWLDESDFPNPESVIGKVLDVHQTDSGEQENSYFHQIIVGGMHQVGYMGERPEAAGIVSVFPVPTPWRPQRRTSRIQETVKFCELWVRDADRDGDWTTIQFVYPDVLIEGLYTRRNLSKIPGHTPFVKIEACPTPGYFWGRSVIADIQMLQDVLNKRLRDIKVMWDRNVAAPQLFSGFTGLTDETYLKLISEGGYVADPNPNAKAQKLVEPPPQGYLEELEFIWKMFDEASGFSPVLSGQGESGVRSGAHAQTLVRTSSPRLIDQAARIERQLAESGYKSFRLMQAMDPSVYTTETGTEFRLEQMPEDFQVQVDSHSASPAFQEDNRQVAIALARAGAIDAEDLIHMLHPPSAELLLARLKQRQKAQAQAA